MKYVTIIWDEDDDPEGNVVHVLEHGMLPSDVEWVIEHATTEDVSMSSGRPCVFGYTPGGDYVIVIFEQVGADTIYPVTAYEVDEPA